MDCLTINLMYLPSTFSNQDTIIKIMLTKLSGSILLLLLLLLFVSVGTETNVHVHGPK